MEADQPQAIRSLPGLGIGGAPTPAAIVGQATLVLKCAPSVRPDPSDSVTVLVEHKGTRYELPLHLAITTRGSLRAAPTTLLFGAEGLERLTALVRKVLLVQDRPEEGEPRIARKPEYMDVEIGPAEGERKSTRTLRARITKAPPEGAPRDEIVLMGPDDEEVTITVLVDYRD